MGTINVTPHANSKLDFPALEAHSLVELSNLEEVMIVIGGVPWGKRRTRMKTRGGFHNRGCTVDGIEMAWIADGALYIGWFGTKTGQLRNTFWHAGVCLLGWVIPFAPSHVADNRSSEPEILNGFDTQQKSFGQEIELVHDLSLSKSQKRTHESTKTSALANATSGLRFLKARERHLSRSLSV